MAIDHMNNDKAFSLLLLLCGAIHTIRVQSNNGYGPI